jgi:hypothetical protein
MHYLPSPHDVHSPPISGYAPTQNLPISPMRHQGPPFNDTPKVNEMVNISTQPESCHMPPPPDQPWPVKVRRPSVLPPPPPPKSHPHPQPQWQQCKQALQQPSPRSLVDNPEPKCRCSHPIPYVHPPPRRRNRTNPKRCHPKQPNSPSQLSSSSLSSSLLPPKNSRKSMNWTSLRSASPCASVRLSPLPSKRAGEKKPSLACLFCRGRKIACGPPVAGSKNKTCK